MGLDWKGDDVEAKVQRAARIGINRTMALCVAEAKENHPFTNRTGTAERSVRIASAAKTSDNITVGIWGSVSVIYFKYLEIGTALTRGRTSILQRIAGASTSTKKPKKNGAALPWNGGSYAPTLIPAAKKIYPMLLGQIRWAFAGLD